MLSWVLDSGHAVLEAAWYVACRPTAPWVFFVQGREAVINMPPAPRQKPKQKSAAGAPRQSLLGDLGWALGTGVGMIYLATILCLCAWPCVHFIVQLAQHTNMVSLTP